MAQGDPPVYQLVDSNGNVQAEIRHDSSSNLIIEQLNGTNIDFQSADLVNANSVESTLEFLGRVASTPADADIPTGTTALYYKDGEPETLYQKPDGGTESTVAGGSATDTRTDISDSGGVVVSDTEDITFAASSDASVTVADDGDGTGTVTYDAVSGLLDGENFDGQSTSVFSNLSETDTAKLLFDDTQEPYPTTTSASGTTTIDLSSGNHHRVEVVDNITIAFSNVSSNTNSVTLYIVDGDGAGPYTVSWPTNTIWPGGSATTQVDANSNIEVSLITGNGGATDPEWRARATEDYA